VEFGLYCVLALYGSVPIGGCRHGRPGDEVVSTGGACRWRRRVNAARTPFWFPAVRSSDSAAPAYLCYPRHDLSYAEVEASRLDRQPGVGLSSIPFQTILEELADDDGDASNVDDDRSYALEDRKSVVDDYSDITSARCVQLPRSDNARDDVRSSTSSMSACYSDEEPTHTSLFPAPQIGCYEEDVEHSLSIVDQDASCRWLSPRYQTTDAILTPVTKLDLKSLEAVTTSRQRVDISGRSRPVARSPVTAGEKARLRRCVSDSAIRSDDGQQLSPVRDLPQSARAVRKRNGRVSAADEEGVEDVTADGDPACFSPRAAIPLRAKQAVTCLLRDPQSLNNNAHDDVTISRRTYRCSDSNSAVLSSTSSAEVRGHASGSDRMENVDEGLGSGVDNPADSIAWNVPAATTLTSRGEVSPAVLGGLWVDWSSTSSEYLTPPTRRCPETTYRAGDRATAVTTVCDAASQTPLDTEPHCTKVQTVHLDEEELVTASLRLCGARSPQPFTRQADVQTSCSEQSKSAAGSAWDETTSSSTDIDLRLTEARPPHPPHLEECQAELRLPRPQHRNAVGSSRTLARVCDVTSMLPELAVRGTKTARLSSPENSGRVTASATFTMICDTTSQTVSAGVRPIDDPSTQTFYPTDNSTVADSLTIDSVISPTFLAVAAGTDVRTANSVLPKQKGSVAQCFTLCLGIRLFAGRFQCLS